MCVTSYLIDFKITISNFERVYSDKKILFTNNSLFKL